MKRLFPILCCILLILCACGQKTEQPEYKDYNLNFIKLVLEKVTYAEVWQWQAGEEAPQRQVRALKDPEQLAALSAEIQSRIGTMTERPVMITDIEKYWNEFRPALPIQGYENATVYSVGFQAEFLGVGRLHFVIDGKNTIPACYLDTEGNRVWYAFDNPQEFVETYWNLAEPSE